MSSSSSDDAPGEIGESIRTKLKDGGWEFNDLPVRDDSTMWSEVKKECKLTNPELSRLKNNRCPATTGRHTHIQMHSPILLSLFHLRLRMILIPLYLCDVMFPCT